MDEWDYKVLLVMFICMTILGIVAIICDCIKGG